MLHRTFPSLATLPSLSISLLGPPNSGKSSLLQSLFPHAPFMSAISPKTHTTRTTLTNKLLLSHSGKNSVINITDTPGLVYEAISGSDRRVLPKDITRMLNKIPVTHPHASKPVNICVLDAARLTMHQKKSHNRGNELPRWCNDVMAHAIATGSEYSYLLNKVDLVRDKRELLDLTLAIVELDRKLQINVMNDAGVEGEEVSRDAARHGLRRANRTAYQAPLPPSYVQLVLLSTRATGYWQLVLPLTPLFLGGATHGVHGELHGSKRVAARRHGRRHSQRAAVAVSEGSWVRIDGESVGQNRKRGGGDRCSDGGGLGYARRLRGRHRRERV